jgi:hypothetical protein
MISSEELEEIITRGLQKRSTPITYDRAGQTVLFGEIKPEYAGEAALSTTGKSVRIYLSKPFPGTFFIRNGGIKALLTFGEKSCTVVRISNKVEEWPPGGNFVRTITPTSLIKKDGKWQKKPGNPAGFSEQYHG